MGQTVHLSPRRPSRSPAGCGDNIGSGGGGDGGGPDAGWDQVITIDGLDGPVSVYFDAQGILHARCESDADCFAAEGYFHAAHRFVQMDLRRRLGRGRLSALAGAVTLDTDRFWRMMMTDRDGTPLEEQILAAADDRTRGGARGLQPRGQRLAGGSGGRAQRRRAGRRVLLPGDRPERDPGRLGAARQRRLHPAAHREPERQLAGRDPHGRGLRRAARPAVAQDLFGLRPPSNSTILPAEPVVPRGRARATGGRGAARLHRRMRPPASCSARALAVPGRPAPVLQARGRGSNNWVVGPEPRRRLGAPGQRPAPRRSATRPSGTSCNLDSKSAGGGALHVAGASFAGLPGIVLGQNEDIAWGATTTYFDGADVYVETLNEAGDAVMFDGEEVPIADGQHRPSRCPGRRAGHRGLRVRAAPRPDAREDRRITALTCALDRARRRHRHQLPPRRWAGDHRGGGARRARERHLGRAELRDRRSRRRHRLVPVPAAADPTMGGCQTSRLGCRCRATARPSGALRSRTRTCRRRSTRRPASSPPPTTT